MNYIEFDRLNSLNEFALNSNKITLGEYEQQKEVLFEMHMDDYLKMKSDKDLLEATRKAFWNLGIGENKCE